MCVYVRAAGGGGKSKRYSSQVPRQNLLNSRGFLVDVLDLMSVVIGRVTG